MRMFRDPAFAFVLLAMGLVALAALGWVEQESLKDAPWRDALFSPSGMPLWQGTIRLYATRIPLENFPELEALRTESPAGSQLIRALSLDRTERLLAVDTLPERLGEIVSWGRAPERGGREVLAGAFTRLETFEAGGRAYRVVGGIRRDVAGLHFSYVLPYAEGDDVVTRDWTAGWLDPNGGPRLESMDPSDERLEDQQFVLGMHPTAPVRAWGIVGALILVAFGGALVQLRLFSALASKPSGPFAAGLRAIRNGRAGMVLLHLAMYGTFFGAMMFAVARPSLHIVFAEMVARQFSEGALEYVGRAYVEANIPLAAFVTFVNNFLVQTAGLTVLPSLVLPFFAIFKTVLTFSFTGFALAPLWIETAVGYSYHSITMALELEAYILATYGACLYAAGLFRAARDNSWQALFDGLKAVGSITLLSGVMLFVAACYEAVTLILLS